MDVMQDWAGYLFHYSSSYLPYLSQVYRITSIARTYITILIDRIAQKPDLATVALLLVIIFVSLKLLNMLWQAVLFWIRLARTVLFWGGLAFLAIWAYGRGPDGMVEDVQYWAQVWNAEYRTLKEQERAARTVRQYPGYGRGANRGW